MEYQRIENCSLKRMIGYIIEVNDVEILQFILYITRGKEEFVEIGDEWIFTYGENFLRTREEISFAGATIDPDWLESFEEWTQKKPEENFGLTSQVKLRNGEIKYIPMVDFRCPCSEENLQKIVDTLSLLEEKKGFVVESGNSYHYWGIRLLSEKGWRSLMQTCRMYDIIGPDWPFYQLQDGFSALRVSTSTTKPCLPQVIAKIGNFEFEIVDDDDYGFLEDL